MTSSYQPPVALQESKTFMHQTDINKLVATQSLLAKDKLKDVRLRLSTLFQSTLELEKLMGILFDELKPILEIDCIRFQHETNNIRHTVGRQAKHQVSYRLTSGDSYYGDISFSRSKRIREEELSFIESLMDLFVFPLRNALQYRQAIEFALTDPLTGAGNRQSMSKSLKHEVELANRYQQPLCILMLDIDHFKKFNDQYGHQTGDLVLQSVSSMVKGCIRNSDQLFRYGGEEFLVILNQSELEQALNIAERVRSEISKTPVFKEGREPVTVSIGVANYVEGSHEDLIKAADMALYKAKNTGRNKVCRGTMVTNSFQINS